MLKKHKIISCRWLILLQFNGVPTTPDGGRITLKAEVFSTDAEMIPAKVRRGVSLKKGVLVSVEDTGIGIAKKNQHKIFSEFSQIEEPYIMQCKDTGLELALSKKLVTLHGGKVRTIRFFLEEAGGSQVIVCEDDGAGIPADQKERIFERGFGKNTGFGLFLAREILAITGITIRETGEEGEGARFEIHVPEGGYRTVNKKPVQER